MTDQIKVFIVEDEALIADEIRRELEGLGYEVCGVCYDFAAAQKAIPASDADLFILDINLNGQPGQDGLVLANIIKSSNNKPYIFLTAYNDKDTISKAAVLQPSNYLIKPVHTAALFAAIQLAIAQVQEHTHEVTITKNDTPDFFYVKIGLRKEKLYWCDVYCIEAAKNYARLFVGKHTVPYPIRGTVTFVLEQLVPASLRHHFFRLGRSVCLNRTYVTSVTHDFVVCGGRQFENAGRIPADHFP